MNPANPRITHPFLVILLLCLCATARGEEAAGVWFGQEDWEVACDNTLTCRIAGYCAGEDFANGCASVLITRAAGPDAPLAGEVKLADDGGERKNPSVLTLRVNGQSKGKLKKEKPKNPEEVCYALAPAQIRALLVAARKDGAIEFVGDAKSFTLSSKGISAVLLKADAAQGRIGTLGAFIRKGKKPEDSVFPPRPRPLIRAAKVIDAPPRKLTAPEFAVLKPLLLQSMKDNACWERELEAAEKKEVFTLTPLDERHVLISAPCWVAATNEGYAYWVTDSALKNPPKLVTRMGNGDARGEIYSQQRGPGNCWAETSWVWDGKAFHLSGEWRTGICRVGDAWKLPTFVADVINADKTPRASD
jgi:hypothetical protein